MACLNDLVLYFRIMRSINLIFGVLLSGCAAVGQQSGVVSFSVAPLAITQTLNDGGINDAGQIVFNDGASSYLLQPGGTVTQITGEQRVTALTTLLHGINNLGQTVGAAGSPTHAVFRGGNGGYSDLNGASAFGINLLGQIVGTTDATGSSAFITTGVNANYQTFRCPGSATSSQAMGINGLGQVVGSCTTTNIPVTGFSQSAFFRDTDGTIAILSLPGSTAAARGINDAGQIVGSFYTNQGSGPGPQQGFFRNTDGTVTTFGAALYGINNSGQILGVGYYAPGKYGPFIATIIPSNQGVISHIAAGGGWSTEIALINTSTTAVPVTVALHNDDGSPMTQSVTTTQQNASQTISASSVSATISPNATLVISLCDPAAPLAVGWADVISSGSLNGYAIFRTNSPNSPPSEGTVPLQRQLSSTVTLPYDNTAGMTMGVALANVASGSASVTATMWDDSGNSLGTQSITIAGSGHTSFVLSSQLPPTAGKRGIVRFESADGAIAGLGLRFSSFGTFTSVPTF